MTMPRVEVITSVESAGAGRARRRSGWLRRPSSLACRPRKSPRSAGIHVSQLFRWRKDLCWRAVPASGVSQVPVEIVPRSTPLSGAGIIGVPGRRRRKSGIIEIELGGGRRVRVDRDVDAEALRRVLDRRSGPV